MEKCNFFKVYALLGTFILFSGSLNAQNANSDEADNSFTNTRSQSWTIDDDDNNSPGYFRWWTDGGDNLNELWMALTEISGNTKLNVYQRSGSAILQLSAAQDDQEFGNPYLLFTQTSSTNSRAAIFLDNDNFLSFSNNSDTPYNKGFRFFNGTGINYPGSNSNANYGAEVMRITTNGKVGIGKVTNDPTLDLEIKAPGWNNPSFGIGRENGSWDHYYVTAKNDGTMVRSGGAENGIDFQIGVGGSGTFGDPSQAYESKFQIYPDKVETKTKEVTLNYGTTNDLVQVSMNTDAKVNHSVLTIAGATYIGSNAEKATTGDLDKFKDEYLVNYNLWVEDGIVTEDLAFAAVNTWKDEVFEENYDLISLEEVERFTKANKHLPEVPSEKEIKATGYTAHQMNLIFMQKIEELTLYTIQLNKQVKALEAELTILKSNKKQ